MEQEFEKIVVIGDVHGRMQWYDIILKERPDLTIFMGDYISTHEDIDEEQQCINLEDILNYKQDTPDKVILLRGNHDMQHLGYSWAECSGYCRGVAEWMSSQSIKKRFLDLTQWVYIYKDLVFSHAGISDVWFKSLGFGSPSKYNILKINQLSPSEAFAFTPERMSDWSGDSTTQPLTWIRPSSLIRSHIPGWNQVVGHTRLERPGNIITPENKKLYDISMDECWFIDCMPFQYMVIEGDKRYMKEFKK